MIFSYFGVENVTILLYVFPEDKELEYMRGLNAGGNNFFENFGNEVKV